MSKRKTREEWLNAMTQALRPKFKAAGYPVPTKVHVSCGWPSNNGLARKNRTIGQCWSNTASASGHFEIFISPTLADGVKVGGVLVHELAHAALEAMHPETHAAHGALFQHAMKPLGMTGKATATTEGAELTRELVALVKKLGKYPHAALKFSQRGKVQTTRLLKVACPECGYTVRTTAKWVEIGYPTCVCGTAMEGAA